MDTRFDLFGHLCVRLRQQQSRQLAGGKATKREIVDITIGGVKTAAERLSGAQTNLGLGLDQFQQVPEIAAPGPRASPDSAVLSMRILPSRGVVERFTLPEHKMNMPRGLCPSTNRIAPAGRVLLWLIRFSDSRAAWERPQEKPGLVLAHCAQLSTISSS